MDHAHMDHSSMDHGGMDHGGMDHGHGGMKDMCSMNMLFTWDATNLCIVFRQWHVRSTTSLLFSLVAVILLAMGYEALRSLSRRYEQALDNRVRAAPSKLLFLCPHPLHGHCTQETPRTKENRMLRYILLPFLPRGLDGPVTESTPILPGQSQGQADQRAHLIKAILYALQNFYAFMLMLVFMTYNGWVMISVSLGAFLGYLFFGQKTSATKENACH
ncbi:unnamed protein product [Fusarium equiseti]|uniref:Copper transport protein n=1 Tax=Fusarium equiseti TaxID=61235 RepID=A0A8J2IHB2_FUSEQ|nr:unnamed protein product [Fusarium equiseti]